MKKAGSTRAMFEVLTASQDQEVTVETPPGVPPAPLPGIDLFSGREEAIKAVTTGRRVNNVLRRVPPARCRLWAYHDRRYDLLSEESCKDLIDGFQVGEGQQIPAIVRRVTDDDQYDWEIICGARRHWTAVHLQVDLLIEERALSDAQAFALSDQENRSRADISDYERAVSYRRALEAFYGGVQSRMATIIGIDRTVLSRYLDMLDLDPAIIQAIDDVREITRQQVRELRAAIESTRYSRYQIEENRRAVIAKATELAEDSEKKSAKEVFKTLMAEISAAPGRGRPSSLLGSVSAASTGKIAVLARKKAKGGLTLEVFGDAGASMDEVREAINAFLASHYSPREPAS